MVIMDKRKKTKINYIEIFGMYGSNEKIKIIIPLFDNFGFMYDMNYDINYCIEVANNHQFELTESFYNDKYVVLNFKKIKCKSKSSKEVPPIQRRIINEV